MAAEAVAVELDAQSDKYEEKIVVDSLADFAQRQTWRATFAAHWEEVSELILPTSRNTFYYGSWNFPGQKKTDRQVDATGALALDRFTAILDSLQTPRNMTWHQLAASNPYLMKNRRVRLYFEAMTRLLFRYRYMPSANFSSQNANHWQGLGAFGTAVMFCDRYDGIDGARGLRYRELPLGECYLTENHQGQIDSIIRHFRLTPAQAIAQFGAAVVGPRILALAVQNSQMPCEFIHRVVPRADWDPVRRDSKGMKWASYYIGLQDRKLMREGGYRRFPFAASRYIQTPNEIYGRSPAMIVLPALKTLNAQKKDFLTQGHRAASPAYLMHDDGIVDFSSRPGSFNKGGMTEDGKALVGILPTGQIQVSEKMMEHEAAIIDSAFLVDLFKVLLGDPKIFTATQIVEMMSQRGILIAPTVGRQQSEYLGPLIEREIDVLNDQRLLPPMPPELAEAEGEYHVVYTSPLAREMRAQEIAGFQRTMEGAITIAQATQDPSILDRFDFDTALPDMADIQSVPESWMASDADVQKKRQARQQAQQQQQQIQAAPAAAAMLKARAAQAKAGIEPEQNAPATPGNAQNAG